MFLFSFPALLLCLESRFPRNLLLVTSDTLQGKHRNIPGNVLMGPAY